MAHVTGPDFVALYVRDLTTSRRFYTEELGLTIDPDFTNPSFVTFATNPILFAIREAAPGRDHGTPGLDLWLRCDDVDALHAALSAHDVPILQSPQESRFGRMCICQDPDGHALVLYTAIPLEQARHMR